MSSKDAKLLKIRRALSSEATKYGYGGREKSFYRPRPITLAKVSISTSNGDGDEYTSVPPARR
jgi:hypothetical protein